MAGKIDPLEIVEKYPQVIEIVKVLKKGIADAQLDGKMTCEDWGELLALAAPKLGHLADQLIEDAKD